MWRAQNYLCPLLFCFLSSDGVGWGGFFFLVHLYFCMFLLSVYGAVAPHFSAIVKSNIFIFCCYSPSIVACVSFVKSCYLQFCEVVAGFLGVVVGWVGLLSLCSLPFLQGWLASLDWVIFCCSVAVELCFPCKGLFVLWFQILHFLWPLVCHWFGFFVYMEAF